MLQAISSRDECTERSPGRRGPIRPIDDTRPSSYHLRIGRTALRRLRQSCGRIAAQESRALDGHETECVVSGCSFDEVAHRWSVGCPGYQPRPSRRALRSTAARVFEVAPRQTRRRNCRLWQPNRQVPSGGPVGRTVSQRRLLGTVQLKAIVCLEVA
jgi:hypothetical protein